MDTPILFLIFNRPDVTAQVFSAIAKVKPKKMYIAADGPRSDKDGEKEKCLQTREIIDQIDWDCDVKTLLRSENLGCKIAVSSAIDWFFEYVEFGIILEDDCLPSESFFSFCSEMLVRYRNDSRVVMVSGQNYESGVQYGDGDYYFSKIMNIWGWATWRRAWCVFDSEMTSLPDFVVSGKADSLYKNHDLKLFWVVRFVRTYLGRYNTWDYSWVYSVARIKGISIRPKVNMITNIGDGLDATHGVDSSGKYNNMPRFELTKIKHPGSMEVSEDADEYVYRYIYDVWLNSIKNPLFRIRKILRRRVRIKREIKKISSNKWSRK